MKKCLLLIIFLLLNFAVLGQSKLSSLFKSPCDDVPTRLYANSEYTAQLDLNVPFAEFLNRTWEAKINGLKYLDFKQRRSLLTSGHDSTQLFGHIAIEIPGEKFEKATLAAFIEIVKKDNRAFIRIYDIYYRYDLTNCILTFQEFSENALSANSYYKEHPDVKVNEKAKYQCERVKFIDEKMQKLLKELKNLAQ